ncbi:MAG TPA: carboxypeptidase-like regulatory domain-containing protein [Verrucomicrobiae bacterium]|nr:carboxypeptidase-like regulatory domain-containing protein [Verrucomicrobiae bacterium]
MNPAKIGEGKKTCGRGARKPTAARRSIAWLSLSVLFCGLPALAQSPQTQGAPAVESGSAAQPAADGTDEKQENQAPLPGIINGTVVDASGAAVVGAEVTLTRDGKPESQKTLSGSNGQYSLADVAPGPFQLTITAEGFATQTITGILHSGEIYVVPQISLAVATAVTQVQVTLTRTQEAEAEVKDEEKQRVLGFIPNFYVSYAAHPEPLTPKQKFELAWRTTTDPVTFGITGAVAGIQQANNTFSGYGQGAQGYGKRYGASYADLVTGTFIGSAILPSLLKQDPRYFYKGTGSVKSRFLYAIANSVICKGDNGRWQPNYSNILGSLAAGGISNLYYPASDRDGAGLTFENALIGIGATGAANLLQEFVIPKLTPHIPIHQTSNP